MTINPFDAPVVTDHAQNSSPGADHAKQTLGSEALSLMNGVDKNLALTAGTGFVVGGALTGAGEYVGGRGAELLANVTQSALASMGGTRGIAPEFVLGTDAARAAKSFLIEPAPWQNLLKPRSMTVGGLVMAGLATAGYELYEHLHNKST